MRAVVTRVSHAKVEIDGKVHSQIGAGLMVLLGVLDTDVKADAEYVAKKVGDTRIFSDSEGKMNLSCEQIGGEILVVSNFTLYGDTRKGNRPSFVRAARPELAEPMYEYFCNLLRERGYNVGCGVFGADMQVSSVNDGPVTLVIDSPSKEN